MIGLRGRKKLVITLQWKADRKWCVMNRIAIFTIHCTPLQYLENTACVTYETNYNDCLSYYFYYRVRTEVRFNVIC